MSDDHPSVTLLGDAMVPLVQAAATLEASDVPPFAVIGGVAVAVRLGRVLRATADLDTVTDYRHSPTALEILQRRHDSEVDPADPHTIRLAGTEIQFQDVAAVSDDEIRHLETKDLLYVASHAHALVTATTVRIRAGSTSEQVEANVPVATTGALIAMKLHAYLDRRSSSGPDKRPGDLWDIYNLLQFAAADAARGLLGASPLLREAVRTTLQEQLVERSARARTVLRSSRDERYQSITAAELEHVAGDLLQRIQE